MFNLGPVLVTALLVAVPSLTLAEDGAAQEATPSISVELNSALQLDTSCQLTFVLKNTFEAQVGGLVFETVLLTKEGAVDRLTLFDMRDLPAGTPRVRQFNVPQMQCESLGMVLINGVNSCEAEGLDPAACAGALTYSSRLENVEMLG